MHQVSLFNRFLISHDADRLIIYFRFLLAREMGRGGSSFSLSSCLLPALAHHSSSQGWTWIGQATRLAIPLGLNAFQSPAKSVDKASVNRLYLITSGESSFLSNSLPLPSTGLTRCYSFIFKVIRRMRSIEFKERISGGCCEPERPFFFLSTSPADSISFPSYAHDTFASTTSGWPASIPVPDMVRFFHSSPSRAFGSTLIPRSFLFVSDHRPSHLLSVSDSNHSPRTNPKQLLHRSLLSPSPGPSQRNESDDEGSDV